MNARGQLEQLTLGNGVSTDKVYDQLTGRLQSIKTGNGTIQSLSFNFDKLGNLTERSNYQSSLSETFQYDDLNRLTETKVDQYSTSIQYDKLGNITHKSGVGNYTYGTKPHAVISVNGVINTQYSYDANGNRISANGQKIKYTSFNKPRHITQGDNLLEFKYGPTYRRYEQKVTRNGLLTTTNYIGGGIFEREISQDWEKHTHYIFAGGESVATYIDKNHGIEEETHYLHKDHLGSIDTITNEQGDVVKQFSFDAWGKRRDPKTSGTLTEDDLLSLFDKDLTTDRGFTGHEHLDEVQLIHMNGRVYDPVIGRFLSADPIVQAPTFSQSLNRYSYVLNNPLSLVDPSGFSWWSKKVKPAFKKYWKPVVAVAVGFALGAVTFGIGSAMGSALAGTSVGMSSAAVGINIASLTSVIVSGAGFGFGSAFTGTLLYGGDIKDAFKAGLKGGVIGGVTAGLTYGVGHIFFESLSGVSAFGVKTIAHGIVQGTSRVAKGGKFEHGFMSGTFGKIGGFFGPIGAIVAAGTAEEMGGGKFTNGAVTGAFVYLFNDLFYSSDLLKNAAIAADGGDTAPFEKELKIYNDTVDKRQAATLTVVQIADLMVRKVTGALSGAALTVWGAVCCKE
jgi:RHS repeat-associated protein